jgi:glycosyltransferase involved in cell wall biosynthesis
LKILHIIVGLEVGGAETMLRRLIEFAPAEIPNTVVVSMKSLGEIGESLSSQGVKVQALNMTSALSAPITFWRLIMLIRRYRPDIVQTWMYHADLLGGLAARLAGCRNVVWGIRRTAASSNDLPQTTLIMKICARLSRWVPRKIICVAEAARQAHISAGYDANRMTVIRNGFDFSNFAATAEQRLELRRECGFAEDEIIVGMVGRFHPDKGQDNFVKAAAIVVRSQPEVRFMLVGRGCDVNNARLTGWMNEHGLQDRFVLLGERHDVPVCLSAMDVYCMPSRTEGFPNGLGEAMAMGLPCVATLVGDTAVLAGDTAILVPPEDAQALARGLSTIVAMSKKQREQMGRLVRERVMAEFSIGKARERFDAVYRGLLSGVPL